MLEGAEKEGLMDFLNYLGNDEVLALADTITKKLIRFETFDEAVNAICLYASNASDVLSRQKVHKQLIFNYLYQKGVQIDPNCNKGAVVSSAVDFWKRENQIEAVASPTDTNQLVDINDILDQMGKNFSNWYFQSLNCLHPTYKQLSPNPSSDTFAPSHFCPDCEFFMTACRPDGSITQIKQQSANNTFRYLSNLILNQELFFQPNMESGVKVKQDVHGLIQIIVGGTLYLRDACVGVFEQGFGLVRDVIRADLWKIKHTKLTLRHNSSSLCLSSEALSIASA